MIENIEKKLINKQKLTEEELSLFLDYIVLSVKEIVNDETFINKCDLVQGLIGRYLNKLNINNYPCITNKAVMPNVVGHSFIVAAINDNNYIIDPAFIQFALMDFEELYINHLRIKPKSPIYYASLIDKEVTKSLLINGYVKLDERSAYLYGNCFYQTLTNVKDDYIFKNKEGRKYISEFLKGNEKLRKYDYDEIETLYDKENKKNEIK